jgi:hypothetical protein
VASDITLYSRYECKYIVSPLILSALRAFVEPFLEPDPYAAAHADLHYTICSLYFDSDDLCLYEQTVAGDKDRFKLRVRTYDDTDSLAFFEIKRR